MYIYLIYCYVWYLIKRGISSFLDYKSDYLGKNVYFSFEY